MEEKNSVYIIFEAPQNSLFPEADKNCVYHASWSGQAERGFLISKENPRRRDAIVTMEEFPDGTCCPSCGHLLRHWVW